MIVDDGNNPVAPMIVSELGGEVLLIDAGDASPSAKVAAGRLVVRLRRLDKRVAIGEKTHAASSATVTQILRGETEMNALHWSRRSNARGRSPPA